MTRLMVSVRSAREARCALDAGADMIDVKEPRRGALGACPPHVWHDVRRALSRDVPISAALGELRAWRGRTLPRDVATLDLVKLGLSGCGALPVWRAHWREAVKSLPPQTAAVAVAYADHRAAGAPSPVDVLETGIQLRCRALLVDTYDKTAGNLFAHATIEQLQAWIAGARRAGLWSVLAGSLGVESLGAALQLAPDVIAVRGAACGSDRGGEIDAARVTELVAIVRPHSGPSAPVFASAAHVLRSGLSAARKELRQTLLPARPFP